MQRKGLMGVLLVLPLAGCGWLTGSDGVFRDRQGDYLVAPVLPDLKVPADLDDDTLRPLYVIPPQITVPTDEFARSVPRPKPLDTYRPEGVVIQRIAGEAWIVVAASPQQVWPRVRDFWVSGGIELGYENPQAGILETGWLENAGELARLENYRVVIEPGLRPGSSEIYVLFQDRLRTTPPPTLLTWPEVSLGEGRGYTILEQISQYLADRTDIYSSSSASLLAGSLAGDSKASFTTLADGHQALDVRIGFPRAWAQVNQALERAELAVLSSDRDAGTVRVTYGGTAEPPRRGFFGRLFGGDDTSVALPEFTLEVEETDGGVRIRARAESNPDDAAAADALLQTLLTHLG